MSESLTTHAPNRLPSTSFFNNDILEVCKNNTQASFLGLTGTNFTADEVVTLGHTHDTADNRITWKLLYSFPLCNNGAGPSVGGAGNECNDALLINHTSFTLVAICRLFLSSIDASQIESHFKVSNDNSAITTCRVRFDYYETDMTTLIATQTATFSTITANNRQWLDNLAVDLSAGAVDPTWPQRIPVICMVFAKMDALTELVALHEIAFGVTP